MKGILVFLFAMAVFNQASAEYYYRRDGSTQEAAIGAVEMKGTGIVNLVAVLEYKRVPEDTKVFKSDKYTDFFDRVKIGAKTIALKLLLEKPTIEISELKPLRERIDKSVSSYFESETKSEFPNESIQIVYGLSMLYVSDPFENKK
ncbi:MAG: hypothetical protein IPN19_13315 [Elusimicrobia bacterium]|nr:hypothetical protein [Elusimicrobiota bacterium]